MSVDWTPDQYEYSQEDYNQQENASTTPAYSDNPDWYYEEDGGYQSCLGALPKAAYLAGSLPMTICNGSPPPL